MRVLVTGSGRGIGKAAAELFLERGHEVYGIDIRESAIEDDSYHHFLSDVTKPETLPELENIEILVNAAGVQDSSDDILVNLRGTMNTTEKYGVREGIRAVVNIASASAHTGAEFPAYSASKGGVITYTRNTAIRIARWGAVCNSISPGGVMTESNAPVIENGKLWEEIMNLTPLKKWATKEEIAEWIYFLSVTNRSMSGEDVLIDNGESHLSSHFVWPGV